MSAVRSQLELLFAQQAKTSKIAAVRDFERDYRFDPVRKWQVDFAWLTHWVALEIEGGAWAVGRHQRPQGFLADIEKYNALTVAGWRLVRASSDMVLEGDAIALVEKLLASGSGRDGAVPKDDGVRVRSSVLRR